MIKLYQLIFLLICLVILGNEAGFAQARSITGKVVDEQGSGIPGVSILVKGTTTGTISDVEGAFSLNLPENAQLLIFSAVGYKAQEQPIDGRSDYNIKLATNVEQLNEIVVIGYGEVDKKEITTSISSISQKELNNLPVAGIDQAIQGRLSGVTVNTNGGQPGGGVSVRVRGITSVNGNEPLYVIDGVPVLAQTNSLEQNFLGGGSGQTGQSALASINPQDIESIDVLKDASAQAIYGSRAANGVVLITTKKGKAGEGKITYDTYFGTQVIPKKLSVMDLRQNAIYQNSVLAEINAVTGGNQLPNPEFANTDILGHGTDWQDEIYQKGGMQSHMLSFSGGQDKTNYYFSGGYFKQTGTLIETNFERFTLRASIDHQVKSWLKAGFSANLNRSNQKIGLSDGFDAVTSTVLYNSPATPVRDVFGNYIGQINIGGVQYGNASNPVAIARLRDVRSVKSRAFGAIYAEIKFMQGLTLRNELNYDFNLDNSKAYQPDVFNKATNTAIITPSKLREQRNTSLFYALKNYLNYSKAFGKHSFLATLGHEIQYSKYDYVNANRQNLTLNLPSLAAGLGGNDSNQDIGAGAGIWSMESFFGRVIYTFNDRYAINITVRRDGSSSFGPNQRWGSFPAASVSWTASNEEFIKNIKFINFLKVRAGLGSVGNQNVNANSYTSNVNLVAISPFGNGSRLANVANPDLSWESVKTYNAGIDATLFNNIVELSFDVYKKVTTKMLLPTQLGSFSGLGTNWDDIQTPIANNGQITNTGIDISVTTNNIKKSDLTWRTTAVFSHFKNNLDFLNTPEASIRGDFNEYGTTTLVALSRQGYPVGAFYGYVTDGLYTTMEQLNNGPKTGLDVKPDAQWLGDIKYKDIDGDVNGDGKADGVPDGKIDDFDVTFLGNPNPKFTLGLTNTVSYKGFDLTVFVYTSYGAKIFNYTRRLTEAMNSPYSNQLTTVMDRYTSTNTGASMPRYNQ